MTEQNTEPHNTDPVTAGGESNNNSDKVYTETEFNQHMAGLRRKYEEQIASLEQRVSSTEQSNVTKKTPNPTSTKSDSSDSGLDQLRQELNGLKQELAFSKASEGYKLTDAQRSTLKTLAAVEQPAQLGEWLTSKVTELGWAQDNNIDERANATSTEQGRPHSDKGPAAEPSWDKKMTVLDWSPDDIARIMQEKGEVAGRKFIKEMTERQLRDVRIVRPRR